MNAWTRNKAPSKENAVRIGQWLENPATVNAPIISANVEITYHPALRHRLVREGPRRPQELAPPPQVLAVLGQIRTQPQSERLASFGLTRPDDGLLLAPYFAESFNSCSRSPTFA